ncbi:NHLP bacteriocin export ABC transporter permease/ATPase subunit [Leptolyngbya sp. DQ-M1]|uniref:NHLP bacteriocin export ABC transporter permease/ATPase subunit n=1 Tax=Leptolyngbya sp. DQ-M1 TaxID=2933920 RepID=UPI0032982A74
MDALLIAAGAVARTQGIVLHPPQSDRSTKDPLEDIARSSRIRKRRILLEPGWWKTDSGSLLGYLEATEQLIALLPIAAGKYEYFDPVTHKRIPINAHTAAQISPSAWMFYRPFPHQIESAIALLHFALANRLADGVRILWLGLAAVLLGMVTPQAIVLLITQAIPTADRDLLLLIGAGLLVISLAVAIFQIAQRRVILRVQTIAEMTAQAALWDHVLRLKLSFFRQYTSGDLRTRVLSINQIRELFGGVTLSTLLTSLFALLNLGLLFIYNVPLAIVVTLIAGTILVVTARIRAIALKHYRSRQTLEGIIFGTMTQLLGGIAKLRVAGAENRAFDYWHTLYRQQLQVMLKTQAIEDLLMVFNTLLPTVSSMFLFGLAALLIHQFGLLIGTFLAFNVAFSAFIQGATGLSNTLTQFLQAEVLWEQAQPILQATPEVDTSHRNPEKLTGRIKLDRVDFRYRDQSPLALNQVTLEAEPGELIALVGASGSGKSTLFRLLLGFDTPESGTVYYDDQDLAELDITAVRRQLGVVLQQGRLQNYSIFENIANGAIVTLDEAWEAARLAGIADDIRSMPMEMHTLLSEGGLNLSGGQRQRLFIARALVLKPRILLLDEATSALDNLTQATVNRNLEQLNITRIMIAHRLSTIRQADRIYVLDHGSIVQQGTFDQLATQPGLFQTLIARQSI